MRSAVWVSEVLGKASARQRAVVLSLLAIISALLSTYTKLDPWNISIVWEKPLLPGVYFGLVMSFGVLVWVTSSKFEIFTVFIVTVVAWLLAQETAQRVHESLIEFIGPREAVAPANGDIYYGSNFVMAISGGVGGLVGAAVTVYGVSLAHTQFRNVHNWCKSILIGGVAGVLLELAAPATLSEHSLPIHFGSFLPLFLVWQLSVAASIGYGLGGPVCQNEGVAPRDTISPS
jgi:hypothetical protein